MAADPNKKCVSFAPNIPDNERPDKCKCCKHLNIKPHIRKMTRCCYCEKIICAYCLIDKKVCIDCLPLFDVDPFT